MKDSAQNITYSGAALNFWKFSHIVASFQHKSCKEKSSFFCYFLVEQNTPLSCNSIYLDYENCEDLQLLQLTSYSRVTNQHLNKPHQRVPLLRTFHRYKLLMKNHVKAQNYLHCTLSVSKGQPLRRQKLLISLSFD